jgi:hypothetical protein
VEANDFATMKAMKQFSSMVLFCVLSANAFAERLAPPTLPSSAFADTEASTNIAIAPLVGGRSFTVSLSLDATASNCVEVAVGHDADPTDGVLSHAESSIQFGWDGGFWFLAASGLTNRVEVAPVGSETRKSLLLRLGVHPNDKVRDIALFDGASPLLPPPTAIALPAAATWNMLRVTTRGCAPPQENLEVRNSPDGTQLIMR